MVLETLFVLTVDSPAVKSRRRATVVVIDGVTALQVQLWPTLGPQLRCGPSSAFPAGIYTSPEGTIDSIDVLGANADGEELLEGEAHLEGDDWGDRTDQTDLDRATASTSERVMRCAQNIVDIYYGGDESLPGTPFFLVSGTCKPCFTKTVRIDLRIDDLISVPDSMATLFWHMQKIGMALPLIENATGEHENLFDSVSRLTSEGRMPFLCVHWVSNDFPFLCFSRLAAGLRFPIEWHMLGKTYFGVLELLRHHSLASWEAKLHAPSDFEGIPLGTPLWRTVRLIANDHNVLGSEFCQESGVYSDGIIRRCVATIS